MKLENEMREELENAKLLEDMDATQKKVNKIKGDNTEDESIKGQLMRNYVKQLTQKKLNF